MSGVGANNPSLRLYTYERATGVIVDYTQYYLDLEKAKATGNHTWDIEYKASDLYG